MFPHRAISLVDKEIKLENGENVNFSRLLLCTGARPKRPPDIESKFVYTLRDTISAKILSEKVRRSKKIVLVGNGGIALELVHALKNVEIIWCSRHNFGRKFLDEEAMQFLLDSKPSEKKTRENYTCTEFDRSGTIVKTVTNQG